MKQAKIFHLRHNVQGCPFGGTLVGPRKCLVDYEAKSPGDADDHGHKGKKVASSMTENLCSYRTYPCFAHVSDSELQSHGWKTQRTASSPILSPFYLLPDASHSKERFGIELLIT